MSGASWAVQKGLYGYLNTNLASLSPAKAVYDAVPEGIYNDPQQSTRWPFVVLGESTEVPSDSHTSRADNDTIVIHVWSRYNGDKEVKQIGDALVTLLHHKTTEWSPGTGWSLVYSKFELREHLRDPDGMTRHGVLRFRVEAQEA